MRYLFWLLLVCNIGFSQNSKQQAKALFLEKEYTKAEQLLSLYIKGNINDTEAIELLGDAYGYQTKWDKAINQYKILVDKTPNNANYHYKYGGALGMKALSVNKFKALGIIGDVKAAFLKVVELNPRHIDAHWALVDLYVSLPGIVGGSNAKALNYAKKLKELSALDGNLAIGYVYEYDKEPELAEIYYKKAMDKAKRVDCESNTSIRRNAIRYQIGKVSADYNLQLDKGEKCINAYIENISSKDGVPKEWAFYRLAQIYKHRANKVKALEYIDKALAIKSNFKQAKKEKVHISSL